LSHFLLRRRRGPDASPTEKVYVILSGELTVIVDGKETVCARTTPASSRPTRPEIINRGQRRRDDAGGGVGDGKVTGRSKDPRASHVRGFLEESAVAVRYPRQDRLSSPAASGAFGALAAKVLAAAGANVALAAGKADELKTGRGECEKLGGQVETVACGKLEANCDKIVHCCRRPFPAASIFSSSVRARTTYRSRRHGTRALPRCLDATSPSRGLMARAAG